MERATLAILTILFIIIIIIIMTCVCRRLASEGRDYDNVDFNVEIIGGDIAVPHEFPWFEFANIL